MKESSSYELFKDITLFKELDDDTLSSMINKMTPVTFKADQYIMHEGEPGDCLYIVLSGRLQAICGDTIVGEVNAGEFVGESALVTNRPRGATVRAMTSSELLRLTKDDFRLLLREHPEQMSNVTKIATMRQRSQSTRQYRPVSDALINFIIKTHPFSAMPEPFLRDIEPYFTWFYLPDGETLLKQGDEGKSMYLIMNGRLAYTRTGEDGRILASGFFTRGEVVGEISALTGEKRTATVIAVRDSEIIKLSARSLNRLLMEQPLAVLEFMKILARRQMGPSQEVRLPNIAIIPMTSTVDLDAFTKKLCEKLPGKTLLLTPDNVDGELGHGASEIDPDDPDSCRLHFWLSEKESMHDFLVFEAGHEDTSWTRHCIRQADRILLVTDSEGEGHLSDLELKLMGDRSGNPTPNRDLIILHKNECPPYSGTARFMEFRSMRHHHINPTREEDFGRIARILTGKSIGLVLGGGGARGFAHIGVIKALKEQGVPIDIVGGTSMGALIAAIYAMNDDIDTIIANVRKYIVDDDPMKEYTFPYFSLVRGRKLSYNLKVGTDNSLIEDLRIPYFAVATNISKAKIHIFDRGELWKSIRASTSLPGIAPPLYEDGQLFVDGGLLNNVPIDIIRDMGAGRIIAINVSNEDAVDDYAWGELIEESLSGEVPSLFTILKRKFVSRKLLKRVPGIATIMLRSSLVSSMEKLSQVIPLADVYARLPVQDFSLLDWTNLDDLVKLGYEYSLAHMDEWKKKLIDD